MFDRNKLLDDALRGIDISPTMERNAHEKYKALSNYLNNNGLAADFSPQGSFYMGTVVRPLKEGKESNYDLDILCTLEATKSGTSPEKTKNDVGDLIKSSDLYSEKLQPEDKYCWTLQYADVLDGIGFSLDIVPAVSEEQQIIEEIVNSGVPFQYVDRTVAITRKGYVTYEWHTSNPLGFGDWFLEISNRQITTDMRIEQNIYLRQSLQIYQEVEEIPSYLHRSTLQRAIQFLKRHRDIYYERSNNEDYYPSSMIITALVADSVASRSFMSIEEIILNFIKMFNSKSIPIMIDGKVVNPVDRREDLAQAWTAKTYRVFEGWLVDIRDYLLDVSEELSFKRAIKNNINFNMFEETKKNAKIVIPTKPWRNLT